MDHAKGKDHAEYCWSCGRHSMAPDDKGYHCTECGATWIDIPVPGTPTLTYRKIDAHGTLESKPRGAPWSGQPRKKKAQK